jgi:uncharacterized protein YaeQ
LRKACGKARQVIVYAFAKSAPTWWRLNSDAISALPRLQVWQLDWEELAAITDMLERKVQLNISIVGGVMYLDNGSASVSAEPTLLFRTQGRD